jgi:triacylglycerol lipase
MSALVEFPPELYDAKAFDGFKALSDFRIENALALMWFSQLAYETGQGDTILLAQRLWHFDRITTFARHIIFQAGRTSPRRYSLDTRGVIGEKADVMVIAFGGTDALVWENIWTDIDWVPAVGSDTHGGFQAAFDAVAATIDEALLKRPKHLFIAGHSLGGAIAALAAERALQGGAEPEAVYTFGMPRVGGKTFSSKYNDGKLGQKTYRLVHGLDVVPRVPPKLEFFHVGRMLHCDSGAKFRSSSLSQVGDNQPSLGTGLTTGIAGTIQNAFRGQLLSPPGPGPYGPLFRVLPQPIRDHLQDRYIAALES